MEYRHFWWEQHLLLTLLSIGEKQTKRQWLMDLEKQFPDQMETFNNKLSNHLYSDGYFCGVFSEIKSFLLVRMLSDTGILRESVFQPKIPESEIDAVHRWRYTDSHPLDKSIINLEFLSNSSVTV